MRYLKKFNESSSYTIDDYISDNFKVYNEQFSHELKWKGTARGTNVVPHLVLSRASTGLLLLTQSTKKNQNLTEIIVEISIFNSSISTVFYSLSILSSFTLQFDNMIRKLTTMLELITFKIFIRTTTYNCGNTFSQRLA